MLSDDITRYQEWLKTHPPIAGGEKTAEEIAADKKAADEKAAADKKAADEKAEADRKAAQAKEDEKLSEGGVKALKAEREAREKAEKEAKAEKKRADALEREKLSEEEKAKKDAEEAIAKGEAGTAKLRRANLLIALAEKGLTGGKAKAAARLLDGVEFDDDDEPTNIDDALTAAKAEYGPEMFTAAKADDDRDPDLHPGPRRKADENDEKKINDFVKNNFQTPVADGAQDTVVFIT
jgi:flagellar biosynthesis GTPase FlhF